MKFVCVISVVFFLFMTPNAIAQTQVVYSNEGERAISYGIGLGSAIAIAVSWSRNKSIAFAILHGILGWLYIIYYLITRDNNNPKNS
jgi:hypothetical protein